MKTADELVRERSEAVFGGTYWLVREPDTADKEEYLLLFSEFGERPRPRKNGSFRGVGQYVSSFFASQINALMDDKDYLKPGEAVKWDSAGFKKFGETLKGKSW